MKASIVIRTYNEAKHLGAVLEGIEMQDCAGFEKEVVIVDSGSTDDTLAIAGKFGTNIVHIAKEDFSFGRSLNVGCAAATGDALVFVSGHCVPASPRWLRNLIEPLGTDSIAYSYGCQLGEEMTKFSERQIFQKYFPPQSAIPQEGFFCNNANAAVLRTVWAQSRFDEDLTGLEDMYLAKLLVSRGYKVAYVAEAPVFHIHDESWVQIRRRFEREAIALQHIMPEIHITFFDFLRYFTSAVLLDTGLALQQGVFRRHFAQIVAYRLMQFWGCYRGNHFHRQMSKQRKEMYFYPRQRP